MLISTELIEKLRTFNQQWSSESTAQGCLQLTPEQKYRLGKKKANKFAKELLRNFGRERGSDPKNSEELSKLCLWVTPFFINARRRVEIH